jgi:hypothetical protein
VGRVGWAQLGYTGGSGPRSGDETIFRARAEAGAAAGAVTVGAAAGKSRGDVHGEGVAAQVSVVVVRELSAAAEGAAGVGHQDGEGRGLVVEPAPRARRVLALMVEEGDLVRWRFAAQAGQVSVHKKAGVAKAELEVRKFEEIVGVGLSQSQFIHLDASSLKHVFRLMIHYADFILYQERISLNVILCYQLFCTEARDRVLKSAHTEGVLYHTQKAETTKSHRSPSFAAHQMWCLRRVMFYSRGLIQVGEARSRKTDRLSQSAQRVGRAQLTQWTLRWTYILYTNVST